MRKDQSRLAARFRRRRRRRGARRLRGGRRRGERLAPCSCLTEPAVEEQGVLLSGERPYHFTIGVLVSLLPLPPPYYIRVSARSLPVSALCLGCALLRLQAWLQRRRGSSDDAAHPGSPHTVLVSLAISYSLPSSLLAHGYCILESHKVLIFLMVSEKLSVGSGKEGTRWKGVLDGVAG